MNPIYTCCCKHVDTHTRTHSHIYIMRLCTLPSHSSPSLFCSLKQTHAHALPPLATHTHARYSCTHSLTHVCSHTSANTPKAFSVCDAAWGARAGYKQQGVWHSRRRCVGRPYAFHQALMKMNAHTLNHAQYCHIRKKKNTQKTIYSLISYFSWLSLSYSDTHLQQILYRFQMVHTNWNRNSSSKPLVI